MFQLSFSNSSRQILDSNGYVFNLSAFNVILAAKYHLWFESAFFLSKTQLVHAETCTHIVTKVIDHFLKGVDVRCPAQIYTPWLLSVWPFVPCFTSVTPPSAGNCFLHEKEKLFLFCLSSLPSRSRAGWTVRSELCVLTAQHVVHSSNLI